MLHFLLYVNFVPQNFHRLKMIPQAFETSNGVAVSFESPSPFFKCGSFSLLKPLFTVVYFFTGKRIILNVARKAKVNIEVGAVQKGGKVVYHGCLQTTVATNTAKIPCCLVCRDQGPPFFRGI